MSRERPTDIATPCICGHPYCEHVEHDGAWHGCGCPEFLSAEPRNLGWWVVSGENLLAMLRRAAAGEDPELIYTEEYANSDHEQHR